MIHEPMTLATDYVLAIAAAYFAFRLRDKRAWCLVFVFTAIGSFAGGTFHGVGGGVVLWKTTVLAIGLASFYLLVAVDVPVIIALVKFIVYASWMITHDSFVWVVADYGVTLLVVLVIAIMKRAPWLIGSVAVSVLAALVQQQQIDLHPQFNHNDLYHVVQLVALWMLYRGATSR